MGKKQPSEQELLQEKSELEKTLKDAEELKKTMGTVGWQIAKSLWKGLENQLFYEARQVKDPSGRVIPAQETQQRVMVFNACDRWIHLIEDCVALELKAKERITEIEEDLNGFKKELNKFNS